MPQHDVKIVTSPEDLSLRDLQLNYALLALALAQVMVEHDIQEVSVDTRDKDSGKFNLAVKWDGEAGIGTIQIRLAETEQ